METVKAVARRRDGPPPRKWFNVGGRGRGIQHKGPLIITAALAPFDFEGPRKATSPSPPSSRRGVFRFCRVRRARGAHRRRGRQSSHRPRGDRFRRSHSQWSLWTVLEMLRSPAWVGAGGCRGRGRRRGVGTSALRGDARATVSPAGRRVARPGAAWPAWGTARLRSNSTFAWRRANPRRSARRPGVRGGGLPRFCATKSSPPRSSSRYRCKPGKNSPTPRERRRRTRYRASWDRTCPRSSSRPSRIRGRRRTRWR